MSTCVDIKCFLLSKHLDIGKIINKKKFFRLCRHLSIYIQCILLPKDIDIGKIRKKNNDFRILQHFISINLNSVTPYGTPGSNFYSLPRKETTCIQCIVSWCDLCSPSDGTCCFVRSSQIQPDEQPCLF